MAGIGRDLGLGAAAEDDSSAAQDRSRQQSAEAGADMEGAKQKDARPAQR